MPTIVKPKKQHSYKPKEKNLRKCYNSYRNIRDAYIIEHPLCEMCLEEGKTTPVSEVHHKTPILTGKDDLEMLNLATDPDNLIGLCQYHHHLIHKNQHN